MPTRLALTRSAAPIPSSKANSAMPQSAVSVTTRFTGRPRLPAALILACYIALQGAAPSVLAQTPSVLAESTSEASSTPETSDQGAGAQRFPSSRSEVPLHGWTILVDDRLLTSDGSEVGDQQQSLGTTSLRFLEGKLYDITLVVPPPRLQQLREFRIVLDLNCGDLDNMQYHPSARWLTANGYDASLEKCVHIPVAAQLPTARNVSEQPWVILHELAHAFHDNVLGFDHAAVRAAFERYRDSGRGEQTLLFNGQRVQHYGLNNEREFFAEMTESLFGVNDFYPFNRAELIHEDRTLYQLMCDIWQVR